MANSRNKTPPLKRGRNEKTFGTRKANPSLSFHLLSGLAKFVSSLRPSSLRLALRKCGLPSNWIVRKAIKTTTPCPPTVDSRLHLIRHDNAPAPHTKYLHFLLKFLHETLQLRYKNPNHSGTRGYWIRQPKRIVGADSPTTVLSIQKATAL